MPLRTRVPVFHATCQEEAKRYQHILSLEVPTFLYCVVKTCETLHEERREQICAEFMDFGIISVTVYKHDGGRHPAWWHSEWGAGSWQDEG